MKKIGNSILNWFINSSSVSYTSCLVKLLRLRLRCSSCSDGKNDGWVGCVTSMLARKPNPCAKIWLTLRMLSLVLTRNYFRQIFKKIKWNHKKKFIFTIILEPGWKATVLLTRRVCFIIVVVFENCSTSSHDDSVDAVECTRLELIIMHRKNKICVKTLGNSIFFLLDFFFYWRVERIFKVEM